MIIKFTNFNDGVHYFELSKNAEKLGLDKPFTGNVLVNCKMDKSHSQIVLDCNLLLNAEFTCDRCTENITKELRNRFQAIYFFGKDDAGYANTGVYYISLDSDKIDISFEVKDFAELSVPLKILCRDDCNGLCRHCGINLNEKQCNCEDEKSDSIWEPLQKIKDQLINK